MTKDPALPTCQVRQMKKTGVLIGRFVLAAFSVVRLAIYQLD